jgi:hypothetical protein
MTPTMMVSMALVGLVLLAEAHVQRTGDEEGDGDAQVDEIVHGLCGCCSTAKMPAHPILPS